MTELEARVIRQNKNGVTPTMMGNLKICKSEEATAILKKYGLLKKRGYSFKKAFN